MPLLVSGWRFVVCGPTNYQPRTTNLGFKPPAREEIHGERRRQRGHLHQVPRLLADLAPQLHPLAVTADGVDQAADDGTADTGPICDLLNELRRVLVHNIGRGTRFLALSRQKDVSEVGIEGEIDPRLPFLLRLAIELFHRDIDVLRRDIDLAGVDDGIEVGDRAGDTFDVPELLHSRPSLV